MTQHGLLIDYEFCTGCHACEVACKVEKNLGEGEFGIKLAEIGPWKLDGAKKWEWDFLPMPTQRCDLCRQGSRLRASLPVPRHGVRARRGAREEGHQASHGPLLGPIIALPAAPRRGEASRFQRQTLGGFYERESFRIRG